MPEEPRPSIPLDPAFAAESEARPRAPTTAELVSLIQEGARQGAAPTVAEAFEAIGRFPPGASDAEKIECLTAWACVLAWVAVHQQRLLDGLNRAATADVAAFARVKDVLEGHGRLIARLGSLVTGVDLEVPRLIIAEGSDPAAEGEEGPSSGG